MKKQMHVGVDEARQQCCIAEFNHLRALRMIDRYAHCFDALAFNENLARLEDGSGIDLKQLRCVEDDGGGCRRLRGGEGCGKDGQCRSEG